MQPGVYLRKNYVTDETNELSRVFLDVAMHSNRICQPVTNCPITIMRNV